MFCSSILIVEVVTILVTIYGSGFVQFKIFGQIMYYPYAVKFSPNLVIYFWHSCRIQNIEVFRFIIEVLRVQKNYLSSAMGIAIAIGYTTESPEQCYIFFWIFFIDLPTLLQTSGPADFATLLGSFAHSF